MGRRFEPDRAYVNIVEWKCPECVLTLHYKEDMGDRQYIVDDLKKTHMRNQHGTVAMEME